MKQILGMSRSLGEGQDTKCGNHGNGEPFDNYDEVIKAVHLMNMPTGLNIGYRHITISTSGIVQGS